jgi:hypothetical protein
MKKVIYSALMLSLLGCGSSLAFFQTPITCDDKNLKAEVVKVVSETELTLTLSTLSGSNLLNDAYKKYPNLMKLKQLYFESLVFAQKEIEKMYGQRPQAGSQMLLSMFGITEEGLQEIKSIVSGETDINATILDTLLGQPEAINLMAISVLKQCEIKKIECSDLFEPKLLKFEISNKLEDTLDSILEDIRSNKHEYLIENIRVESKNDALKKITCLADLKVVYSGIKRNNFSLPITYSGHLSSDRKWNVTVSGVH